MSRLLTLVTFIVVLISVPLNASSQRRSYTTGIADIVRTAFRRGLNRFIYPQTSYDSDVFRYTQLASSGATLYAGESCRLTPSICSHDEQCCSGRCLCRRWLITGEQRCLRKCF